MNSLPTVPCRYCGTPTTYTGTQHCDPCHAATKAPLSTLFKILLESEYLIPYKINQNLFRKNEGKGNVG